MYHVDRPDGHYEIANRVEACDPPRTISWQPGQEDGSAAIGYDGWFRRYDLAPEGAGTAVTLTYDWSAVPASGRAVVDFPPFGRQHLENSLAHLDELATTTSPPGSGTGLRTDAGTPRAR